MEDTIIKILSIAAHAPSSHNTQPWMVRAGADGILIGYEPARQLLVGDPEKRELFISLGCYAESIVLAAEDLGYSGHVAFQGTDPEAVARINFSRSDRGNRDWGNLIVQRRSDRRLYDEKPLAADVQASLRKLSYGDAGLRLFTGRNDIDFLADKTYQATERLMAPQEFRDELASWVRNNWTKQPDGMPGYTQGMPGPVSLLAKFVIRNNRKVAVSQAKSDSERVRHSSAVGLICVQRNAAEEWFAAGRVHQRACLLAQGSGVNTSAVSAAIILPDSAKEITERLRLSAIPVSLLRFGYKSGQVKAAPRRDVNDVILRG